MAKTDIVATWQTCKTLIKQAETYANPELASAFENSQRGYNCIVSDKKDSYVPAKVPESILSTLRSEFNTVIEFIISFLLQDSSAALYALILMQTETDINFMQRGLTDVVFKEKPFKFKFNPLLAGNQTLNTLIGAVINEIVKIVYLHQITYSKINSERDPKKHEDLEIGSSVSSTEIVLNDISLSKNKNRVKLHDDIYRLSDLEEEIDLNRSISRHENLEYYYKISENYRKKNSQDNENDFGQGDNPHGSQNQSNQNQVGDPVHDWESQEDSDNLKEDLKQMVKDAYSNLDDKQKGNLPYSITQQIELLFKKPELNWKDILRRYIGNIPSGHRKSPMRLNRRQPFRPDLSGQLSNKVVKLVIAIDTSGSMSDHDIEYCMNEIYNIVKGYQTDITVIECDAEIGRVYNVKSTKDIKPNVTGRGGTEFTPVIKYINEHRFRDAVMIYFTDGYGEWEIPRPRTYRNLWVIRGREPNISLKNPYGEVKCLSGDLDY